MKREDFPILQKKIHGKPLVYFDSGCMTLRPQHVIDKVKYYYEELSACAGRSAHYLSQQTDQEVHAARRTLQKFIGAKRPENIVFTRNTTESINIVARHPWKGDVLCTDREHNSNLVPWQLNARRNGNSVHAVLSDEDGQFSLERFQEELTKKTKVVSVVHTSNIDGYTTPLKDITKMAHDNGSLVVVDAAQSAPHQELNVKKLGVDFLGLSGHKMLGPTGTGILYGTEEGLEQLEAYNVGGSTVSDTMYDKHELLEAPGKFEAGLQDYAGIMGFAEAAKYVERVGLSKIHKHIVKLNSLLSERLREQGATILGPEDASSRGGISSFLVDGVSAHDVSLMLSEMHAVMTRSGAHCAHSWFNKKKLSGSVRASLYLYNTKEEVETFSESLKSVLGMVR